MLHVIENDEAVIEHQHRVVEADFVAQTLRQALDEPHHVIAEITDGARDQRRQARQSHGAETLDALAQERDGIAFLPHDAVAAFQYARAAGVAENFFRVGAGKRVARDFFTALHAFQKEGISRALSDS